MPGYEFNPIERYIGIPPGETLTYMQDVYLEAMDWVDSSAGITHPLPLRATGKIPLGTSGAYTDVVFSLLNNFKLKYLGGWGSPEWPDGLGIKPATLLNSFDDISGWFKYSGSANSTFGIDYTNSIGMTNKNGMRINCEGNMGDIGVKLIFPSPVDFSWINNYDFWIYIDDIDKIDHIHVSNLMAADGSRGFEWQLTPSLHINGWNHIIVNKTQFVSFGAADWLEPTEAWAIHIMTKMGASDTFVTFDEIGANSSAVGTVVLMFREARIGTYTQAFPIMQSYGFTGAVYVDKDLVGTAGYCSLSQLKELHDAGWDIYPCSHNTLLGGTSDYVRTSVREQQQWCLDNGLINGNTIYKYSSEGYDDELIERIEDFFEFAISNTSGFNSYPFYRVGHKLKHFRLDANTTTILDIQSFIERSHSTGTCVIFGFRDIEDVITNSENYSTAQFTTLCQYLNTHIQTFHSGDTIVLPLSTIVNKQKAYQATIVGTCVTEDGSPRTIQPDDGTVEITFDVSSSATIHAPIVNIDIPDKIEIADAVWTHSTAILIWNRILSIWRSLWNRKTLTKNSDTYYTEVLYAEDNITPVKTTTIEKIGNIEIRQ